MIDNVAIKRKMVYNYCKSISCNYRFTDRSILEKGLAQLAEPYLNDYVISEMTCAGSVLILALALNMLGITKIKLMNYLPAMFVPIVLCMFIK